MDKKILVDYQTEDLEKRKRDGKNEFARLEEEGIYFKPDRCGIYASDVVFATFHDPFRMWQAIRKLAACEWSPEGQEPERVKMKLSPKSQTEKDAMDAEHHRRMML